MKQESVLLVEEIVQNVNLREFVICALMDFILIAVQLVSLALFIAVNVKTVRPAMNVLKVTISSRTYPVQAVQKVVPHAMTAMPVTVALKVSC
jgi:hypothetical protein